MSAGCFRWACFGRRRASAAWLCCALAFPVGVSACIFEDRSPVATLTWNRPSGVRIGPVVLGHTTVQTIGLRPVILRLPLLQESDRWELPQAAKMPLVEWHTAMVQGGDDLWGYQVVTLHGRKVGKGKFPVVYRPKRGPALSAFLPLEVLPIPRPPAPTVIEGSALELDAANSGQEFEVGLDTRIIVSLPATPHAGRWVTDGSTVEPEQVLPAGAAGHTNMRLLFSPARSGDTVLRLRFAPEGGPISNPPHPMEFRLRLRSQPKC